MKAITLIMTTLVGLSVSHPRPITPTFRFQATRQANVDLGSLVQEFALDLSDVLWSEPDNVVFSPLSISSLMSLMMGGSNGNTYLQLRNALYYPSHIADLDVHQGYKTVLDSMVQQNDNVIVNVATRLFLASGSSILSNFTQLAQENYDASVRTLQFRRNPSGAMASVNNWVNRETQGKIPRLLTQPFKANTAFVAANTVYFNGAWEHPFNQLQTHDSTFNTGLVNITVPMMRTTMTIPHVTMRELNAEMIALPYKGYEYGMFLVKPNGPVDDKTLQEVEFALNAAEINRYIGEMTNSTRNVALPRMRLNFKAYLKNTLKELNVRAMFSSANADFSRITANDHVWVDDMIHQTVVEITETGTEAASATSISLNRIGTSNSFEVNRPCLFFIRHMKTGIPLFWGRIMNPEPLQASSP